MSRRGESSSNWFHNYVKEHLNQEKALTNDADYAAFGKHLEIDNPRLFQVLVGLYVRSVGPKRYLKGERTVIYQENKSGKY